MVRQIAYDSVDCAECAKQIVPVLRVRERAVVFSLPSPDVPLPEGTSFLCGGPKRYPTLPPSLVCDRFFACQENPDRSTVGSLHLRELRACASSSHLSGFPDGLKLR